jgi:hypothetical protein
LALDGHWLSLVHQQGTPASEQVSVGDVAVLQLPIEQAQLLATDVAVTQFSLSAGPAVLPLHDPLHWLSAFAHLPLEQFESVTQRHAV